MANPRYVDMVQFYQLPLMRRLSLLEALRPVLDVAPDSLREQWSVCVAWDEDVRVRDAEWRRLRSLPEGRADVVEADRLVDRRASGLVAVLSAQVSARDPEDPTAVAVQALLGRIVPEGLGRWTQRALAEQRSENARVAEVLGEAEVVALLSSLGVLSLAQSLVEAIGAFDARFLAGAEYQDWLELKGADQQGKEHLARLLLGIAWLGHGFSWQATALQIVDQHMSAFGARLRRDKSGDAAE